MTTASTTASTVYIGSNDGYLYALDANTGSLKWRYNTGSPVSYRSAVSGSVVYTPSADAIDALNASDGSLLWHYQGDFPVLSLAVDRGKIYLGSDSEQPPDKVYVLQANNGSLLWQYKASTVASSPLLS